MRLRAHHSSLPGATAGLLAAVVLAAGCPGGGEATTADPTTSGASTSTTAATDTDAPTTSTTGATDASTSSGTVGSTGTSGSTGDTGDTGVVPVPPACEDEPPPPCTEPIDNCKLDKDHDGVEFTCDNAPNHTNPAQGDMDGDGFGDIADLCPTVFSDANTADTDRDGVGNGCDACGRTLSFYNANADAVPFYMRVRNVPLQTDTDHDGVGDVCDNCIHVPNCQGYGEGPGLTPYVVGMPIDPEAADCQVDADIDMIGDACAGTMLPGAAGPVGFSNADDFDQDGLVNLDDLCPRQPVARKKCGGDGDCPDGASCAPAGVCNHPDHDGDGVGDACDTCLGAANPEQVDEAGATLDDPDRDFIGNACEQHVECHERANPRVLGFYDISVEGRCCVTTYEGADIIDPDGKPIDPGGLGPRPPGVFELPPGCEEALAKSEDGKAHAIKACHVDTPSDLWQYLCLLPAWDQEFDGVPDDCDYCPFAFDPGQEKYVDENNMEWPDYGKYCHGAYDPSLFDPANMCLPG